MTIDTDDSDKDFDLARAKEYHLFLLEEILEKTQFALFGLNHKFLLKNHDKNVPMLAKFLAKFDATGEAAMRIGAKVPVFHASLNSEAIAHGFHVGSVIIAALDFVRIPLMYLSAYVLKEKIPFTINNHARLLYSSIILGLGIAMLAAPLTAPVIAFVLTGIALVVGSFLLGKTLYERYQLSRASRQNKKALEIEEKEMDSIKDRAEFLKDLLIQTNDKEYFSEIHVEISMLQERFESQKYTIETLRNKGLQLKEQIKQVHMTQVINRSIGVGLAAISILGLVLALFFPPVGLGILTGAAIAGGVFVFVRIVVPDLMSFGHWIIDKFKSLTAGDKSIEHSLEGYGLVDSEENVERLTVDLVLRTNRLVRIRS